MTKMSFAVAMKDFFGLRPGTTNKDFLQELKALTVEDRAEFAAMLRGAGYNIV